MVAQSKMAARMASPIAKGGIFTAYLTVQLGALLLASASQRQQTRYLNSTAVTLSELIKFAVSLIGIAATERVLLRGLLSAVRQTLIDEPHELLKVAVPAMLYTIQNNLIYSSLAHIDPVTFQITYQLKLVSSLIATRLLLKKPVSSTKWLSVVMLTLGVVLVQLSLRAEESTSGSSDGALGGDDDIRADAAKEAAARRRSRLLGIFGVLVACGCSGLAGAAMEVLLKASSQSLPRRNLQISLVSLLLASLHMLVADRHGLREGGFFQGYSKLVLGMVALDSLGGVLVSLLLKHASNTLKNFAAPIGIILNCMISSYKDGNGSRKPLSKKFVRGALLVVWALGTYAVA